jgi:hypothetical protein
MMFSSSGFGLSSTSTSAPSTTTTAPSAAIRAKAASTCGGTSGAPSSFSSSNAKLIFSDSV